MTMFSKSLKLQNGASIVTVAIMSLLPTVAFAEAAPVTPAPASESVLASPQDTVVTVAPVTTVSADRPPSDTDRDIIVTGFRSSLRKALDLKRAAPNLTESILAEDMAKMPDLNLSESIQR